jgi:hypothetical protein|tara:strand:+ start:427 stop:657 length:231 start_codon:yes stop_codon:yes gene_type:complete
MEINTMSTLHDKYEDMRKLWNEFEINHSAFVLKGNKAAAARARKAINSLKKQITAYKKQSVAVSRDGTRQHVPSNE